MDRRIAFFTLATLALCAFGSPVRAETANEFVARVKALDAAARPHDETETWNVRDAGMSGTMQRIVHGADERATDTLGPFVTARGTLDGHPWHQTDNGYTVRETEPRDVRARRVASRTLAPGARPGETMLVLTFADGHVERDAYDAHDLTLLRRDVTWSSGSWHLTFDDFRPGPAGRRKAWHVRAEDSEGNQYEATLATDSMAAVDPASLAIPPNRRTVVEFPAGIDQVRLPASNDDGRIHVHVEINGAPLTFLLDTGASGILIDAKVAKQIGLPSYGHARWTVAGSFATSRVIAPLVRAGDLTMHDVVMSTAPFDWREGDDHVVGLLGFDFIAGTSLRISYADGGTIDAIRPGVLVRPPLATSMLPIRLDQQVPIVSVGIGDSHSDDFVVDTGAEAPVLLFDRFVASHPHAVADEGVGQGYDPDHSIVFGVGGRVRILPLRLSSFRFADLDFKNFLALRARDPGAFGDATDDGLLGALFLRYFTVYVDYPGARLFFEPNDNYETAVRTAVR